MDKAEAKAIMDEARAAMDQVFQRHGLKTGRIHASYDSGSITVKVTGEGVGADSPKVKDWERYAESYGLPREALGTTIVSGGTRFQITGLLPNRRKFPVLVKNALTGKEMLLTVAGVKRALGIKVEGWE